MKKRTLALALALGCVFMSPTLSYGEENAEVVSEIEEDSSTDEGNNNSWGKVAVVDDFGDATGQSVISTVVSGTFSNTATTGSDLLVTAYINFDEFDYCYDLSFKLLEYKDTPATYFSSDSKELKIKVGSINTVYAPVQALLPVFSCCFPALLLFHVYFFFPSCLPHLTAHHIRLHQLALRYCLLPMQSYI